MKDIFIKRIYDYPVKHDEYRILVDRVWPRGISKNRAMLDEWNKRIAPSEELRRWFNHEEEKFDEFSLRYEKELLEVENDLKRILKIAKDKKICLLYGAKNKMFNQAIVLQRILIKKVLKDN